MVRALVPLVALSAAVPAVAVPTYSTYTQGGGARMTFQFGINDFGDVSGYAGSGIPYYGFLLKNGASIATTIAPYSGLQTLGTGLNNADDMGGFYMAPNFTYHGFVYSGSTNTYTMIDIAGARDTYVYGVNNVNELVGTYTEANNLRHAFVQDTTTNQVTVINIAGAVETLGLGMNDNGEVVGSYYDSAGVVHGYVYNLNSSTANTFDYPNVLDTWAYGINNAGAIVGWGYAPGGVNGTSQTMISYYSSDPTAATPVFAVIQPETPGTNLATVGINNAGAVVGGTVGNGNIGTGTSIGGLTAVPEPGAGLLMASGGVLLAGLGWLRRRRA
jgi:hypothetical protein